MKKLVMLGVMVINGYAYWVPCEGGGVWCPHFKPTAYEILVSTTPTTDLVYAVYEPAPSMVTPGWFK